MHCNHTPEEIAKRIAELPEPLQEKPAIRKVYFFANNECGIESYTWNHDETDNMLFICGNCFATKEHAQAHADFQKWLYEKPKLTLAQCWEQADENDSMAPPSAKAEEFLRLARENSLI